MSKTCIFVDWIVPDSRICSLIPKVPLWAGVLLTSSDVIIVLIAFNTYPSEKRNRTITIFELMIAALVITVMVCFAVLIGRLSPHWPDVFNGFLPSSTIVSDGALYTTVGIIGATVMPHAIFLGSKLGTIERVDDEGEESHILRSAAAKGSDGVDDALQLTDVVSVPSHEPHPPILSYGPSLHMPYPVRTPRLPLQASTETKAPRSVRTIRLHVHHASIDICVSLFAFAFIVNSAILIVAAAAFYSNPSEGVEDVQEGNLFTAFALIKQDLGNGEPGQKSQRLRHAKCDGSQPLRIFLLLRSL